MEKDYIYRLYKQDYVIVIKFSKKYVNNFSY